MRIFDRSTLTFSKIWRNFFRIFDWLSGNVTPSDPVFCIYGSEDSKNTCTKYVGISRFLPKIVGRLGVNFALLHNWQILGQASQCKFEFGVLSRGWVGWMLYYKLANLGVETWLCHVSTPKFPSFYDRLPPPPHSTPTQGNLIRNLICPFPLGDVKNWLQSQEHFQCY